jgi:hypothetical protein
MSNREPFTLEAAMPRQLRNPERSAVHDESFNAPPSCSRRRSALDESGDQTATLAEPKRTGQQPKEEA